MSRRLVLWFLVGLLAAAQAAEKLVGGPLAVNVSGTRATVVWILQTQEARLGEAPDQMGVVAPLLKTERVSFTGLKPGRTYYYDVMGQDEGRGRFKTPPAGPAAFRFVVFGDTRTRHEVHAKVVEAIVKTDPDFVLHTGDLVADGEALAQWPVFFSIEKELLRRAVFFPTPGNHERGSGYYYEFFQAQPFYSFDWGSVHVTAVNSDYSNAAPTEAGRERFWAEQLRWLEDDLARAQKADLRFVMTHHPPLTAVKRRQSDEPNRILRDWAPLFEKYRVQAVFCGHDHNYQHHLKNGVRYIVTGGGGAPLYPVDAPLPGITLKAETVENFVQADVNGAKVRLQAFTPEGRLLDSIEITGAGRESSR